MHHPVAELEGGRVLVRRRGLEGAALLLLAERGQRAGAGPLVLARPGLVLAAVVVTIIVVGRLKNSRIGLALQALREDEIACEAMGIDLTKVKLSAFALGSCWAGFAGVIFAAKTTFINPASFTFMESAMVLSMVVLGGMGSVLGVTIAAAILVLAPEYLRAFSEYRMLLFGAVMVIMMIYRPQGLISGEKRTYKITNKDKIDSSKSAFDVPATGGQA